MKTKILNLFLLLVTSMGTMFAEKVQIGNLYYNLNSTTKTAEVTYQLWVDPNNYSNVTVVNIPASVVYSGQTYSVTSIGEDAFLNCKNLTSVSIPNTVTSIGMNAFSFSGITSVSIPSSVINIHNGAFSYCSNMTSINVNASNTIYTSIAGVLFNKSGTTLMQCPAGKSGSYTVPNNVTKITTEAFAGCYLLSSLAIPNSVMSIGQDAFALVANVIYTGAANGSPWGARSINGYVDGYLIYGDNTKKQLYACLSSANGAVRLPNSVVNIGDEAFYGCNKIISVNIPMNVASIGDFLFLGCVNLHEIHWEVKTLANFNTNTPFYNQNGYDLRNQISSFIFGENVEYIPANLCKNMYSLAKIICKGETPPQLGTNAIPSSVGAIYPPCGTVEVYKNAWSNFSSKIQNMPLPYSVSGNVNNNTMGKVIVPKDMCDDMSVIASPFIGYHFVQWSDGNTDNPRTLNLVKDTTFTAIFSINEEGTCGNQVIWKLENGVLRISGTGPMTDYNHYISAPWSSSRSLIYSIVIEKSVTSIGNFAFTDCTALASVTIPNSVTSIGERAFFNCNSLISVSIPNSVISIGNSAFYRCSNLTSVTIPNSITSIGSGAFAGCSGLTSVTIPNSITSIGNYTFDDCSALTSVTIPNSVTRIGESAFYGCTGLKKVNTTDISAWCRISFDGISSNPLSYAKHLYINGVAVNSLVIPNNINVIGKYVFYNCTGLTSVTIPNSVTRIGESAFRGCSGLTSIVVENGNTVYDNRNNCDAIIETATNTLIVGCQNTIIPNSVTCIGKEAFYNCSGLTSVIIPNSVASIGENAFEGCSGLTSVRWNAKNCNSYNFGDKVASFIFGDEVEVIPASLCSGMKRLSSIRIPVKVKSIGKDAFKGCDSIASVIWTAKNGNSYNFGPQVETFLFGNEVESIPNTLCSGMSQLTSMVIPNSVKTIGNDAFKGCSNLQTLTLGENITTYGSSAFSGCSSLTSIYNYRRTPVVLNANVFKDVDYFACTLYVLEGSFDMYKSDHSSWKDFFYNIEPISATSTTSGDDIQVVPTDNTANIVWPQVSGAETYELVIKDKSGNVICTLIFNANGQLTSIAFNAPARNNAPQQTQTAGFAFTVTGLNSGTNYDLVMTSKNSNGETIQTKTVSFTTTGNAQSVENILGGNAQSTKILRNGQLYILRGEKTYTLQGQEVK